MQFWKQPHRFTRHIHLQVVSGAMLMLFGILYIVSPFSARSQEPTATPVLPDASATLEISPAAEATPVPTDAPTSTPVAAAAPELPAPTAEDVAPIIAPTAEEIVPTATDAPTARSEPTAAPLLPIFAPLVPAAAPPLSLGMSTSAERAGAGQDVRLTATVSSDGDAVRAVRIEIELDPQLEAISGSASGGTCTVGVPVVCDVTVQGGASATINVIGRVRAEVVVGGQLVSQAVARDDANNTAASDPVVIVVSDGLAIVPMSRTAIPVTPTIAESIASAPTTAPVSATLVVVEPTPTTAPQATAAPVPTTGMAVKPTTEDIAAALAPASDQQGLLEQVAPTDTPVLTVLVAAETSQATSTPAQTDAPIVPMGMLVEATTPLPTDAPVQATPANGIFVAPEGESTQLPPPPPDAPLLQTEHLPNTDGNAPLLGWSSMLLGFALTAHGTRRVRREHTLLAARSRETRQLEPLVDAIAYLSGTVKDETEQMQRISEECIALLRTDKGRRTNGSEE